MEKKLYDACLKGDVEMLEALMREDELTLARVSISSCINQTPLHLASMLGHFELAEALLSYKPDFASRLDSQGRSPLHLASANGYGKIVKLLVEKDSSKCRVSDEDGRTPLHLAVLNGQNECVSELIKVGSILDQEETVLHLCVMYNRLEVLILIIESMNQNLSNIKDDKGNTILHSATSLRRIQIIKYLVTSRSEVDVNGVNENGLTALDIIEQMPKDVKTMEIKELLISTGALRAKDIEAATSSLIQEVGGGAGDTIEAAETTHSNRELGNIGKKAKGFTIFPKTEEKRDETMLVAATVIAAMSYQAAISPPGNVAGMDGVEAGAPGPLPADKEYEVYPSDSLLSYFYPSLSDAFWICNTISFMAALVVIFIYVSGSSLQRKVFFIWLLRAAMWITLTSMTLAYAIAVRALIPDFWSNIPAKTISCALIAWAILIFSALLVVGFRLVPNIKLVLSITKKIIRKIRNTIEKAATLPPTTNTNVV